MLGCVALCKEKIETMICSYTGFPLCKQNLCRRMRQSMDVEQNRLTFGDFWKCAGFFSRSNKKERPYL